MFPKASDILQRKLRHSSPGIHKRREAAAFLLCGDLSFSELPPILFNNLLILETVVPIKHLLNVAQEVPIPRARLLR